MWISTIDIIIIIIITITIIIIIIIIIIITTIIIIIIIIIISLNYLLEELIGHWALIWLPYNHLRVTHLLTIYLGVSYKYSKLKHILMQFLPLTIPSNSAVWGT